MKYSYRLLTTALLCSSCSEPPSVSLQLRLTAPLTFAEANYGQVEVVQGEDRQVAVLDQEGSATLRVRAGQEAHVSAVLFAVPQAAAAANSAIDAVAGDATVVPTPGDNTVEVELLPLPLAAGSAVPTFTGGYPLERPLPLGVIDVASGWEAPEGFTSGAPVSLPMGRDWQLFVTDPLTGQRVSIEIAGSAFTTGTPLPLGAPPQLNVAPLVYVNSLTTIPAVSGDPALPTECALSNTCDDSAAWAPCAAGVAFTPGLETTYTLVARYSEVRSLGCAKGGITYDFTPPALAAVASPDFLQSGVAANVTVTLSADEPLAADSMEVHLAGTTGNLCTAPAADSAQQVSCAVTLPWSGGDIDVGASVADLSGNRGSHSLHLLDASGASLLPTAITTYPITPSPNVPFLLGIDVANFSAANVCDVTATVQYLDAGGSPSLELSSGASSSVTSVSQAQAGVPGRGRLWVTTSWATPATVDNAYQAQISLSYTDCVAQTPIITPAESYGLVLDVPKLRWLAPELVFSESAAQITGGMGIPPPILTSRGDAMLISSDESVVSIVNSEGYALEPRAPGRAVITALHQSLPDLPATSTQVEIDPAPALAVLQAGQLTVRTRQGDELFPTDATIGTPLRVLWESSRDAFILVGSASAQLLGLSGTPTVGCGGTIVDAALSAPATEASGKPELVLFDERTDGSLHHCEIDLDTAAVFYDQATPSVDSVCVAGKPTQRILIDPVSGTVTILGGECAATYSIPRDGGPPVLLGAEMANDVDSPTLWAALDPYGGGALSLSSTATGVAAEGWGVGASVQPYYPLPPPPVTSQAATAAAFDLQLGLPIVAYYDTAPLVVRYGSQQGALLAEAEQAVLTGTNIEALAVDAGDRILYAAHAGTGIAAYSLDSSIDGFWSATQAAPLAPLAQKTTVLDMAIVGPQPLHVSPERALPGGVVTVSGLGFAGSDSDEVFFDGARAEVIASTTTSVRARIPAIFADASDGVRIGLVSVRSHGRVGSLPTDAFTVWPLAKIRNAFDTGLSDSACPAGASACSGSAALAAATPLLTVRPGVNPDGVATVGFTSSAVAANGPLGFAVAADGRRLLGYDALGWLDTSLSQPYRPQRRLTMSNAPASPSVVAADTGGALLALGAAAEVQLFWAPTYTPTSLPPLQRSSADPPSALTFSADGRLLAAASCRGTVLGLDLYDLAAGGAALPLDTSATGCFTGTVSRLDVLALAPHPGEHPDELLLVLGYNGNTVTVTSLWQEAGAVVGRCNGSLALAYHKAAIVPAGDTMAVAFQAAGVPYVALFDATDLSIRSPDVPLPILPMDLAFTTAGTTSLAVLYPDFSVSTLSLSNLP